MLNNVRASIEKAKETLRGLLVSGDVPCTYMQSGREMMGNIINYEDSVGNDIYLSLRQDVRVRSSTGKDYAILMTSIVSIKGLDEL